jgi:signal transduction histidine kinase
MSDRDRDTQLPREILRGAGIRRFTLRFQEPSLESDFQAHRFENAYPLIRSWSVAGIAIYALFGIIEYFYVPEILTTMFIIRYAVVVPFLIGALLLRSLASYPKILNRTILVAVSLPSIGALIGMSLGGYPHGLIYFSLLIVTMLFTHAFTGVRFWPSALMSWIIFFGCLVVILAIRPFPAEVAALCLALHFLITTVAMFMSYNEEIYIRRDFRNNRLLIRQMRNAEKLAAEATAANASKSNFLAMMSHELRTPLNAIMGFSEMISMQIFGPVGSDRYQEYAEDIHQSGRHLLNIIGDILDLSKIEAGRYVLEKSEINLADVAAYCVRMVGDQVSATRCAIEIDISENLPLLRADERACRQILLNLLSNSIKFTPPAGRIVLSSGVGSDGCLWISVADNGIGIPAEEISRVTEPFAQVDNSVTRVKNGTGLGLSLVSSLCKLHGATLHIESEFGKGTDITVRFAPRHVIPSNYAERLNAAS